VKKLPRLRDNPGYRASQRHTAELLEDNRRLEFLRALDTALVNPTNAELTQIEGIMERARAHSYHCKFTTAERAFVKRLQGKYGSQF
jgi:hypothetical protein